MNDQVSSLSGTPPLSVSTWSLHRTLGLTYTDAPGKPRDNTPVPTWGEGVVSLLEIPALVAAMGIYRLEICHFQLPSRDPAYLKSLRDALLAAGVELLTLLVDDGDITDPTNRNQHLSWIDGWIDTAALLGAKRVRVIAGKAAYSPEAIQRSKEGLRQLAGRAEAHGMRLVTENWFDLLAKPEYVLELLDSLEGQVGLNGDFGNWDGPTKYDTLARIFGRAESCHAKCAFSSPTEMDKEDFGRCVQLARTAGFTGPYTLIYDGPGDDEWAGVTQERDLLVSYFQ